MRLQIILNTARLAILALVLPASMAQAGPPFLTDDPAPAEYGHWEIYAPTFEIEGRGAEFEGALAAEANYGAAPNLQLAIELPVAFTHDPAGWRWGAGDVELGVKYRFYHDEDAGVAVSVYPSATLPTGSNGMSAGQVTAFLPVWAQKDFGPWSVFGGGGYAINPGVGNRNYWTGGLAVTREFGERLLAGVEVYREGAGTTGGHGSTSFGLGAIYELKAPFSLLARAGPTVEDHGSTGFHAYTALGLDF
jgi:hypothetical protein